MVLPILIPPAGDLHWEAPRDFRRSAGRRSLESGTSQQSAAAKKPQSDKFTGRLPRGPKFWPPPADQIHRAIDTTARIPAAGRSCITCEQVCAALLRRWRREAVISGAVQRLARSTDVTSRILVNREDRSAVQWMLQAMYWRGCRHPLSLVTEQLHPPTGVLRWLERISVTMQVDQPRLVLQHFCRAMHAYRWRASEIMKVLMRRARRTGRVKLQPGWLDDSVWRSAASSQLHVAKRR